MGRGFEGGSVVFLKPLGQEEDMMWFLLFLFVPCRWDFVEDFVEGAWKVCRASGDDNPRFLVKRVVLKGER